MAGNMQRGSVFFLKLASCIAVLEVPGMPLNSPIEGGTLIALSNPTKHNEMTIGIDQLDPSCVSKHFERRSFRACRKL